MIHFFDVIIPAKDASWILVAAIIGAVGIPLLVLSILGLRMLVKHMRSIGTPAKIVLVVLWIISIITLSIILANVAASQAFEANIQTVEKFEVNKDKVFEFNLNAIEGLDNTIYVNNNSYDFMEYNGEIALRNYDIRVAIASTTDSVARMIITQKAKGSSYDQAKEHATEVVFDYEVTNNVFNAPNYVIVPKGNALSHQKTQILIYLPEGTKFKMNTKFYNQYYRWISNDGLDLKANGQELYEIGREEVLCISCEKEVSTSEETIETVQDSTKQSVNTDGEWKYE